VNSKLKSNDYSSRKSIKGRSGNSQQSDDFGQHLALAGFDDGLAARVDVILLPGRLRTDR
jgi:hypothetical protein